MITAFVGDIDRPSTHAVAIPTNGIGSLSGGCADAIIKSGGEKIKEIALKAYEKRGEPFEPGMFYKTSPGNLRKRGVRKIYYAITTKYPSSIVSLHCIGNVMKNVLEEAIRDKVESIAFPGFGTGSGRLDKVSVANIMLTVAKKYDYLIDIVFVDRSDEFIETIQSKLV